MSTPEQVEGFGYSKVHWCKSRRSVGCTQLDARKSPNYAGAFSHTRKVPWSLPAISRKRQLAKLVKMGKIRSPWSTDLSFLKSCSMRSSHYRCEIILEIQVGISRASGQFVVVKLIVSNLEPSRRNADGACRLLVNRHAHEFAPC